MTLRRISIVLLISSVSISSLAVIAIPFLAAKLVMIIIGAILMILFIFISVFFWRCPYCKQELPIMLNKNKDLNNEYECPYCGEKFK